MKIKQKKSKRIPCAKRYRNQKQQKERQRKLKKEARKNPIKPRNPDKDLRVPNKAPFKERVLQEAIRVKSEMLDQKKLQRLEARAQRMQEKFAVHSGEDAAALSAADVPSEMTEKADHAAHSFVQEVNKVIEKSDVVVQVLDARDPIGTRCREIETAVVNSGKRLVLLLNKCDLIPADNLKAWLSHLRLELPTVPFKASTQSQNSRLSQNRGVNIQKLYEDDVISNKRCLGAQHLLKILGNYCRNRDIKTSIKVGIVGYPNVGKSSVINSLKRSKACVTGATPGVTRQAQEVTLDKYIQLVDSPGVIYDKRDCVAATLRNARRVEALEDPVSPALEIVKRANKEQLMLQYKVTENFRDGQEFLALLARARGFVGRGGIYNPDQAARLLINDWNSGRIKYYTVPPEESSSDSKWRISTSIVSTFAKEFEMDFKSTDESLMRSLPRIMPSSSVLLADAITEHDLGCDQHESQRMDTIDVAEKNDPAAHLTGEVRIREKQGRQKNSRVDDGYNEPIRDESYKNLRQNRGMKDSFKRVKKLRKRADKISEKLTKSLRDALG
ncbi:guanine nucleotide-binding protein-like 3 homolog [Galendromus occidentalis]|uniref:Guanine nucleotide-binding protein-like 3 homolog n=1 Tax=Galendromus occidentalis TaxID=34638 RepID=A0AAJ6QLX6_9ACAR|nr:guanine nucleotide-binding protein-like 3 homolog [Galendromus occidentalis]